MNMRGLLTAVVVLVGEVAAEGVQAAEPTGLMVDFKRSPSLGVRTKPAFTWIVPPCEAGSDHAQVAYQLTVTGPGGEKA